MEKGEGKLPLFPYVIYRIEGRGQQVSLSKLSSSIKMCYKSLRILDLTFTHSEDSQTLKSERSNSKAMH
jgi:hypothetical protein